MDHGARDVAATDSGWLIAPSWLRRPVLVVALPLALTLAVVWPVHDNQFRLDDILLLYTLANYGVMDLLLTPHGGHSLLTSSLAYVGLDAVFGPNSRYWFPFMIATHLVNVALLFRIIRAYTGRIGLAAVCACLWGAAPVHHEALGWFTVYGHVLVTTCVLWVLLDVARMTEARSLEWPLLLRWTLLFLVAATSFGTGLALAMTSGLAMIVLFPRGQNRRRAARALLPLIAVVPMLYLGQQLLYAAVSARPVLAGVREALTITRGVNLTPSKAVEVTLCVRDLFAYGTASMTFGPLLAFKRPASFVGPLTGSAMRDVMPSIRGAGVVMLVVFIVAVALAPPERRRALAGIAMLAGAAYVIVALWWMVTLRSSTQMLLAVPIGCAPVPRYHYAATSFIAILIGLSIDQILQRWPGCARVVIGLLALLIVVAVPLYVSAYRALDRLIAASGYDPVVAYLDRVIRQTPAGGVAYLENRAFRALLSTYKDVMLPGWAAIFAISHPANSLDGRGVQFCEHDAALLRTLRSERGTRMSELLVAPDEAPPGAHACRFQTPATPPRRPKPEPPVQPQPQMF